MCDQKTIFTFGANEKGRHGRGAALHALQQHGAIYGQGYGLQGRSFAIPTKGQDERRRLYTLPLKRIEEYVRRFLDFAAGHPELTFNVTRIGCGLAGLSDSDIAPMFRTAPPNCRLPAGWQPFIRQTDTDDSPSGPSSLAPQPLERLDREKLSQINAGNIS